MAFYESPRFPDRVSFGAEGGPAYSTDVVRNSGGYEYRNQVWLYPLHAWVVGYDARLDANFATVRKFYRAMKGRANSFRFKDWTDFRCPDQSGSGRFAAIDSTHFQMFKLYNNGSPQEQRKITKPVSGTITVTGGAGVSIDHTTGIVTVSSGTPTDWVGQFDVPCRFDTDKMDEQIISRHGSNTQTPDFIVGWRGIAITEIRI